MTMPNRFHDRLMRVNMSDSPVWAEVAGNNSQALQQEDS
jgi:hypothetical protein